MDAPRPTAYPGIRFQTDLDGVTAARLRGFFVGWPNPPTPETHLRILRGCTAVVLAVDAESGRVVGFVTALSDGVLSAYLPLLEVLPGYRGRGIGSELVRRVLVALGELYMVDVTCDPDVMPFYLSLGLSRATGASMRRYPRQSGAPPE